jgi:Cu-Zn family superoxide dismutase
MYLLRLSAQELLGRSIILHAGGDTYSDVPKLGGGGARLACGLLALLR